MVAELTVNRTDEVYATVRKWILSLKIRPGSSFSETALAVEVGTSKTPVREALVRLRREGLVKVQSRSGYTVAPITFKDAQDICQLRTLLDGEAARLAAESGEEDRAGLSAQAKAVDALGEAAVAAGEEDVAFERWLEADVVLHLQIARTSGNDRLVETLGNVLDQVMRLYYLRLTARHAFLDLIHDHSTVVRAVQAQDPLHAREAATATGKAIEAVLLDGVLKSDGVQFANAAPQSAKNTFYLDTNP